MFETGMKYMISKIKFTFLISNYFASGNDRSAYLWNGNCRTGRYQWLTCLGSESNGYKKIIIRLLFLYPSFSMVWANYYLWGTEIVGFANAQKQSGGGNSLSWRCIFRLWFMKNYHSILFLEYNGSRLNWLIDWYNKI